MDERFYNFALQQPAMIRRQWVSMEQSGLIDGPHRIEVDDGEVSWVLSLDSLLNSH